MASPLSPSDVVANEGTFPQISEGAPAYFARLAVDLTQELTFGQTELLLTATELVHRHFDSLTGLSTRLLSEIESMSVEEHRSLGRLRVVGRDGTIDVFRFTAGTASNAHAFVDMFEAIRQSVGDLPEPTEEALEETLRRKPKRNAFLRMLGFARPQMRMVIVGLGLTIATTTTGLVPPYLTMPLVDKVLIPYQTGAFRGTRQEAVGLVLYYLSALAGSAILTWLLAWGQGFVLSRIAERVTADLRNRTFTHLHRLSLGYFGGKRTGDLMTRISTDTERLCSFFSDTLVDFVTDVLMIIGTAGVLFWLDPGLAAATFLSFPILATLILKVRGRLNTGFLRGGRAWSAMTSLLSDSISGIRVVKAFSQERREIARFEEVNQRIFDVNNRVNSLWTFFWPFVAMLNQLGLLVVWAIGAYEVFAHHVTVGVLTAFVAYIGRFYVRLETMSRMLASTQRALASAQRLFEVLDRQPSVAEPAQPMTLDSIQGHIGFENVSFRYNTRLVLDHINLEVKPGEMVGIVGSTGSGKSTLANLLCRFYDATDGRITVDGFDLRDVSLSNYRRHLGVVLQDPYLFFGTVAENVSYGKPSATWPQILEATRAARAHEFILRLPDGYDSLTGERGQSLSGGERQRISIARAILVDPRLLVLDEATSAIDVRTEREIQRAIDRLVQGRTTIAIAHRLSTLERADRIIVLSHGRIVETGRPKDLLAQGGAFADLVRAQQQPGRSTVESTSPDETEEAEAIPSVFVPFDELKLRHQPSVGLYAESRITSIQKRVVPVRAFPLTLPNHAVCLIDERGHEISMIEDLDALDEALKEVVLAELAQREFRPFLLRIEAIDVKTTHSEWHVITDRGKNVFRLEDEDQIRLLGDHRLVIVDHSGTRYVISDERKLDEKSRKLLHRFT
jgi:ATP-binding cassette, subfamily B, bacterial